MDSPETSGGFQPSSGFMESFKPVFVELRAIEEELDRLEVATKVAKQRRAELEEILIPAMDNAECPRIVIAGMTFFRRNDAYPRVKDQDGLFKYLQEEGRADLIKPTVNAQSLRSLMLERMRENQPVPECVEMLTTPRVGTRS